MLDHRLTDDRDEKMLFSGWASISMPLKDIQDATIKLVP
jgi:hypothetical protein